MNLMLYFYTFMTALFAALIMVPFLRRWALDTGTVDAPGERKMHAVATPRLGGVAIGLAFAFSLFIYDDIDTTTRGILAGTLIIFVTGLVDDLHGLSPKKKFFGQIAGCLVAMTVGDLHLSYLGNLFGWGEIVLPGWLAVPFTVFAVIGVTNAVNLIDGLDGLAGGISVIALATFGLLAWLDGNGTVMILCAALLGALLGFLKYNFYPARIFMGDTGSLVVGFVLAFLAISLTQGPHVNISPIVPLIVLGLPIIDTIWVLTRRLVLTGKPFAADKHHVHHKFLDLGFNHRFTVLIIYGISLLWAAFALFFRDRPEWLLLYFYIGVSVLCYLGLRHVLRHPSRFGLLRKDGAQGLLEGEAFGRLANAAVPLGRIIQVLVLFFIGTVAVFAEAPQPLLPVVIVLLAASGALLFFTRDLRNDYVLLMAFFSVMVLSYLAQKGGGEILFAGVSLKYVTDLFCAGILLLLVLRVVLRRPGTLFLSSIDFLILGLSIVLAALAAQMNADSFLAEAVVQGIVIFFGIKLLHHDGPQIERRLLSWAIPAALLVVVIRGGFG